MGRVLLIDDEPGAVADIVRALRDRSFEVVACETAAEAQVLWRRGGFHVLAVDMVLSDGYGLDFVRTVRADGDPIAIVAFTGHYQRDAYELAFQAGADDFATKEDAEEIVARIVNQVERLARGDTRAHFAIDVPGLRVEPESRTAWVRSPDTGWKPIHLSKREAGILKVLGERKGRFVTQMELLDRVWPPSRAVEPHAVEERMSKLLTKLGSAAQCIESLKGKGYRLRPSGQLGIVGPGTRGQSK